MAGRGSVVVIGGTSGLGKEVARHYAKNGREVVISGRDRARAAAVADEIGGRTRAIALDLARALVRGIQVGADHFRGILTAKLDFAAFHVQPSSRGEPSKLAGRQIRVKRIDNSMAEHPGREYHHEYSRSRGGTYA